MAEAEQRRRRRRRTEQVKKKGIGPGAPVIAVLVLLIIGFLGYQTWELKQKQNAYQARLQQLERTYEDETERAKEIEELKEYMNSSEYIEDTAKNRLGLVHENEIIFKESED